MTRALGTEISQLGVAEFPAVSVIIPTYNGAHRIVHPLRSLASQTVVPQEIIVVVDGSTDETVEVLANLPFGLSNLRIIIQENAGRAGVRNNGAELAKGDVLLFLDDDTYVPPCWVQKHVEQHIRSPGTLITGALVISPLIRTTDFVRYKLWLHDRWSRGSDHIAEVGTINVPYLNAQNFSVSRSLFMDLGGFDLRLSDAEDYDLAVRAFKAGHPLLFSIACYAYNNDQDLLTCATYVRRLRQYTTARERLARMKPDLHSFEPLTKLTAGLRKYKRTVYGIFATRAWINSIDAGIWRWLPEGLRYKLYDIIITANTVVFPEKVTV
jgi:glycosyltransferase involved in cell wall biosynthesis